ncbi:MAG TPA: RNA polymerase sigma factor [Candidatus Limnocylindrales bacterium]|nr:RNA polymerase sigma factor [Candidatus Limnocylindrales bacterium]
MTTPPPLRFEAAFDRHARVVLAYALRRTSTGDDAEDAVAETFAVAWRRVDRLPEPDASLPWLLAITRRVIANQRRGSARRVRLELRLAHEPDSGAVPPSEPTPALDALARLGRDDQELLRLLIWEGLSHADAGEVLGISANAVAIRLYRARRRFAGELGHLDAKGFGSSRTSPLIEGRNRGHSTPEERA